MDLRECELNARELMNQYIPSWRFSFDRAVRRFGCTHYDDNLITLSKALCELNDWETIRLTVLHEIAHALVGVGHHHDTVWKKKCIEIGGNGERCYSPKNVHVASKYQATCPACGYIHHRNRLPKRKTSCGACSSVFNPSTILNYERS